MARTKQTVRREIKPRKNEESSSRMKQFELAMRKYYPKNSRFFSHGSHYQPSHANHYENGNSRVLQRYKRSFFRSFDADASLKTPQPSKIPNNLQCLNVFTGSALFIKKLIKQNKRLRHIVIESEDNELNEKVLKCLKYGKGLRSITFKYLLPYFSEIQCQKMLKSWGGTLETFKSFDFVDYSYYRNGEYFKKVMETILKFPKLKSFVLKHSMSEPEKYFPFEKLQERNIAYELGFVVKDTTFESLKKNYPRFKPTGLVVIQLLENWGKLGYEKFKKHSKQILHLRRENYGCFGISLLPVFQDISALDLTIHGKRWDISCMGQLNSLKHLAINFIDDGDGDIFSELFKSLNKNIAPHSKLETFMIRFCSRDYENKNRKPKKEPFIQFFEACSESLNTVDLEFQYPKENFVDPEYFYEGLSKLKNLQSLSVFLDFRGFESEQHIEKLCQMIAEIKSLEELSFKIRKENHQEKIINLRFPPQLKKLHLGMDTSSVLFDASKALLSLSELINLELEFSSFSSQKWENLIQSTLDKLKLLKTFVLKGDKELRIIK